jgi:chloride channel 7
MGAHMSLTQLLLLSMSIHTTSAGCYLSLPPVTPALHAPACLPHPQVPDSLSVERTYILFRTMGLRHLMVIDEHCHVRGIVTRKDLLGHRLGKHRPGHVVQKNTLPLVSCSCTTCQVHGRHGRQTFPW